MKMFLKIILVSSLSGFLLSRVSRCVNKMVVQGVFLACMDALKKGAEVTVTLNKC